MTVDMSDQPTSQVGSAAAIASQSSWSRMSIAVSPPQGGTTARMSGSVSMRGELGGACRPSGRET